MPDHEVPEAGDLHLLAVGEGLFHDLEDLLHQLGGFLLGEAHALVDLLDDPRFATNAERRDNVDAITEILDGVFSTGTRAHWIARIRAEHVPCGPINSVGEAIDWGVEMEMDPIVTGGDGYRSVRCPVRLDGEALTGARRPPRLGEHTDEIRTEVGG